MLNIFISGASGKMGKALVRILSDSTECKVAGGTASKKNKSVGLDLGKVAGINPLGIYLVSNFSTLNDANIIIDFSSEHWAMKALEAASNKDIPILLGTTGFNDKQLKEVKRIAKSIPVLLAPNTSLGVNLIKKIIISLGLELQNYQIEIEEIHHKDKLDSPSGTAKDLATTINFALDQTRVKYEDIKSKRVGDITGEHKIFLKDRYEEIEVIHKVTDRLVFARGAIKASRWLMDQEAGLYLMSDVYTSFSS